MIRAYLLQLYRLIRTVKNWPMYFLQRFGIVQSPKRYRLRAGTTVILRRSNVDLSALNEVWLDRSYDPNAFGISFDWSSVRSVVDVGGHIGTFTLLAAAEAPDALIVTLEPDPENFRMLAANVTENGLLPRTSMHNAGLGDGTRITLYTFADDRGGNSVYRSGEGGTPVQIDTVPLANLFAQEDIQTCDYLKLDCEGAEYDALYACPEEVLRRIRCIGMEYHHFSNDPTHNADHLERYLASAGFRCVRHKKSMMFAVRATS